MQQNVSNGAVDRSVSSSTVLAGDLDWIREIFIQRIREYTMSDARKAIEPIRQIDVPALPMGSRYGAFLESRNLDAAERLLLGLALAPEFYPEFFIQLADKSGDHPVLGLLHHAKTRTFLPTLRTLRFCLDNPQSFRRLVFEQHWLVQQGIIELMHEPQQATLLDTRLRVSRDFLYEHFIGAAARPDFSMSFPAKRIQTELEWEDLVLQKATLAQIREIELWLRHKDTLYEECGMGRLLMPGYRCLFYGPPGTGKTMTASLLGKATGRDVYRIDLSQVVSKYIGETEKNLRGIFEQATDKEWILFFDEADALFGKRGKVSDARDRYANQEVSYLLQRVEDFPGLIILATNLDRNIDPAFSRRFQNMIRFSSPGPAERYRLWQNALPKTCEFEPELRPEQLAKQYELTGGVIYNIMAFAALRALERGDRIIREADLFLGIQRAYQKDGKLM